MQHDRLICLDIETVPDRDLIPADWPADKFPKPIWHRIVAISVVEARIERDEGTEQERYVVECCRSGGRPDWNERRILTAFWRHFAQRNMRMVTWNGRAFDIAVLQLRSLIHGITADAWSQRGNRWNNYAQRFAPDWHCDLMEVLSDYGASARMGLDEAARAMGLPGKIGGHGSEVEAMVERGDIEQVRAYCEGDVLNLYALYVRWAFLTGRIDAAGHNASMESLVSCLEAGRAERPHLGEFLDRWQSSDRPSPMLVAVPAVAATPVMPVPLARGLAALRRRQTRGARTRRQPLGNQAAMLFA
ncbi:3'-5' exonuclease [Microvirga arsenatis]|nr:3'-5' exonuclease [Microvirga arsenatis]